MAKVEALKRTKAHTRYMVGGKRVPAVTTILGQLDKPGLKYWANSLGLQGEDIRSHVDVLASIGTLAHAIIVEELGGPEVDYSSYSPEMRDRAENAVLKFYGWQEQHEVEPLLLEAPLVSETYRFGGTVDFYGVLDGAATIIDFKTSNRIYDEHFHQLAAYYHLVTENGYDVSNVRILRVGRNEDEGFEERVVDVGSLQPNWEIFTRLREIYDLRKKVAK